MPMRRNHRRRNSYAQIPKTEQVLTATRRMMETPLEELFFLLSHIATEDEQRVVGQWFDGISSAPKPPEGKRKHILLIALTLAWFAPRPPTEAESGIPSREQQKVERWMRSIPFG
jgi:hypothetical protein